MKRTIGVLSLQGGFASHIKALESLGVSVREIRTTEELAHCDGLVIPGGESTVITKLLLADGASFYETLRDFASRFPVMGTCAGLIMLARPVEDPRVVTLDVLPVTVERNSYGRQTESFIENIELDLGLKETALYPATFIRAPRISSMEKGVLVLARTKNDIVMVRSANILGLTFHPELTPADTRIHEYFLTMR